MRGRLPVVGYPRKYRHDYENKEGLDPLWKVQITEVPEDTNVDIGVFDLLLPCRSFTIAHKVAGL